MSVAKPVYGLRRVLSSLNADGAWGWALLGCCALLLCAEYGGEAARLALRYDRAAIAAGEWWRLISAHFVHLGLEHAALNALGLVMMWALFARDFRPAAWLLILGASIAAIDIGLWLRDSTVEWYVGSSGALHGIMAAGTFAHVRRGDLDGWILAIFVIVKLSYEQGTGALPFAHADGVPVVVVAHLYGAIGGFIAAVTQKPSGERL
jgi:rhomboid family GlyGly-CTERM serine protease